MAVIGELMVLITGSHIPLLGSLAKSEMAMTSFAMKASAVMVGVGAVAAVIGVKAIESASKFEDAMTLIQTQAGGSKAEVEEMTAAILRLAPSVGTGPQELAEALFHIESTGHRGADALDLLTTSAKLAKIGHADLEDTTNALLAATNSGIGGFTSMSQAAGILNSIIGAGNMRMDELTAAIGTGLLSRAAAFGVTLQSVGASLAAMTYAGLPAEESATKLGMTLGLFGAPTKKAIAQLETIGLTSTDLATAMRGPGGVIAAMQMLHEHLSGLDPTQQAALLTRAFGGSRSSGPTLVLLQMLEDLPKIQQQIIDGSNNLDAAWARTTQDAGFRWDQVGVSVDVVVKAIGLALLPAVESLLGAVVPVASALAQWAVDNPQLAANILLVAGAVGALAVGAAILGPLLALAFGPAGLVIIALGVAIGLIVTHMDELRAGIQVVIDKWNELLALMPKLPPASPAVTSFSQEFQDKEGHRPTPIDLQNAGFGFNPTAPGGRTNPLIDSIRNGGRTGIVPQSLLSPAGGGRPITLNHTSNVYLDGTKVGEVVERRLYDDTALYSSGFSSGENSHHQ